jgi:hypothetical protein
VIVVTVVIPVTVGIAVTIGARNAVMITALHKAVAVVVLLQEGVWPWTRTPPYYTMDRCHLPNMQQRRPPGQGLLVAV